MDTQTRNLVVLRPVQAAENSTYLGTDQAHIAIRDGLQRAAHTLFQDARLMRIHGHIGLSDSQHRAGVTCLREAVRMTAEFTARDTRLRDAAVVAC